MNIIDLLKDALPPTQVEAARLLNVTQPAIHKWMSGKSLPSAKTAIAIERATNGKVTRYQLRPDIFESPQPRP